MNISWVLADAATIDPTQELEILKHVGPVWGSWRTWRAYLTDNVICHDLARADELLRREFQRSCNLYIPESIYTGLARPDGVQVYQGDFVHDVIRKEEIVAMHLSASTSDIVLLIGFDWSTHEKNSNRLTEHQAQHYLGLTAQVIRDNPGTQWVLIDHVAELHANFSNLENLSTDTMSAVLSLIANQ